MKWPGAIRQHLTLNAPQNAGIYMNPKTDASTDPVIAGALAMPRLFRYLIGTLILLSGGAALLARTLALF
jgi:hypothetical protein